MFSSEIFTGFRSFNMDKHQMDSRERERAMADKHQMDLKERERAMADLKFTYVVSCQIYGAQKKSSKKSDQSVYENILNLMLT